MLSSIRRPYLAGNEEGRDTELVLRQEGPRAEEGAKFTSGINSAYAA